MLLQTLFPSLPTQLAETILYVVAGLGIVLITYGIFLERERRQDIVIMLGALCLLDYAIYIHNTVFIVAMACITVSSFIELVEILIGIHKHTEVDLKNYKDLK